VPLEINTATPTGTTYHATLFQIPKLQALAINNNIQSPTITRAQPKYSPKMSTLARAQVSRTRSTPTSVVTMNRDAVVIKKTPVAGAEINKPVAACLAKEKGNGKDGDGNKGQVQEDEEVKRKRK
jgi:hypothetical protein